jgi:hypothetical protein
VASSFDVVAGEGRSRRSEADALIVINPGIERF